MDQQLFNYKKREAAILAKCSNIHVEAKNKLHQASEMNHMMQQECKKVQIELDQLRKTMKEMETMYAHRSRFVPPAPFSREVPAHRSQEARIST